MACKGRYIAVSHRWGGDIPYKTTRQNIGEYLEGIDAARLPQNFIDVLLLAGMLDIRYVWIDAVCIVQNDEDEWLAQAKQMGSIFTNATITLALHSPRTSTEGVLWRMRVPEWLKISPRAARTKELPSFWLRLPTVHEYDFSAIPAISSGQLVHRGWCLQELWLSPRILHVVEDKFIWICPHIRHTGFMHSIVPESIPSADDTGASHACWQRLVTRYSRCELTVHTDKLPALSGIHSLWPKAHTQSSHCGHLGIDIRIGLLWYRERPIRRHAVTRILDRAPSWSWASVDGPIRHMWPESFDLFKRGSVQVKQADEPAAFECQRHNCEAQDSHFLCELCHVVLRSKLRMNLRRERPTAYEPLARIEDPKGLCWMRWEFTLYAAGLQDSSPDDKVGFGTFDEDITPQSLSCVQISSISEKQKIIGCCVLLLVEEDASPAHHYRRVGVGWLPSPINERGWQEERIVIV